MRAENANFTAQNTQLNDNLARVLAAIGADSVSDTEDMISAIQREHEKLREASQQFAGYAKHYRKQSKRLAAKAAAELSKRDEEIQVLKSDFDKLADENSALEAALEQAKQQLLELQRQLKQTEKNRDRDIAAIESEKREFRDRLDSEKRELESQLAAVESERSAREEELDKAHREIANWKRRSDLLVNERREKEGEISQLKRELEESARDFHRKAADERASAKLQTDKMLDALRQKNRELSELTQKTSEALVCADERNRQLAAANTNLVMEKDELAARLQSVSEEAVRQRQLMTTKLRAVELASDTRSHNQIEDTKANFEQQKRNIYAAVVVAFQGFYDGKRELDEHEFQNVLARAQGEMGRLAAQDLKLKRLLGLDVDESIEDAISELLRLRPFVDDRSR
jgi:chromosome segregation ATPase